MVSPIILPFGPLEIRLYGILFALALAQGIYLFQKFARQKGISQNFIDRYILWLAISIVIGARLGEVLFYEPAYYFSHPWEIPAVWHGGLASFGALIAGIITTFLFTSPTPSPYQGEGRVRFFFMLADLAVIPIALGAAIVRIANFFNAEIVGRVTALPWGISFANYEGLRHPVQLYEAGLLLIIFLILLLLRKKGGTKDEQGYGRDETLSQAERARCPAKRDERGRDRSGSCLAGAADRVFRAAIPERIPSSAEKQKHTQNAAPPGLLFFSFLFLYLFSRFFLEFLKDMPTYEGLTTTQWLSVPFILLAIIFLILKKDTHTK
jgi:prolipoprotein diacylglyceryl transferase